MAMTPCKFSWTGKSTVIAGLPCYDLARDEIAKKFREAIKEIGGFSGLFTRRGTVYLLGVVQRISV
jgi:hypothetical protein